MAKRVWSKKGVLREALLGIASNLGPGKRMPTVAKLCTSLSVSNSTLDPILRELAIQGAIVREHGRGIFVSPTIHHKTIGVVFGGDIFSPGFSPFWSLLLGAVRRQAAGHAVEPRAYLDISERSNWLGGHAQLAEDLDARRLDGLLLLAPHHECDEAGRLREYGVPLVVFGGTGSDWTVTHDVEQMARLAARELAGTACRRIGLMGSQRHRPILEAELRQAGSTGVEIADWSYETWAKIIPGAGTHENCAHRLTQQMIAEAVTAPLPDALVSTEDTATRGAITALQQAGLHPGHDIRIVTSANKGSAVLGPYAASLTQIEFDSAESVAAALDMLETIITGQTPTQNPVLIAPQVIR